MSGNKAPTPADSIDARTTPTGIRTLPSPYDTPAGLTLEYMKQNGMYQVPAPDPKPYTTR